METVLRVGRKGIVILPKRLREALGVGEGDLLAVEVREGVAVLRPLKLPQVRLSERVARAIQRHAKIEELVLEEQKLRRIVERASS